MVKEIEDAMQDEGIQVRNLARKLDSALILFRQL